MPTSVLLERSSPDTERSSHGWQRTRWRLGEPRVRLLIAAAVAAAAGVLAAAWTPRGPITTAETLVWMGSAAVLGLIVGVLIADRRSLLLAPAAFVTVFELARIGVEGPTVDAPRLTVVGFLVWAVVRVLLGVLVLVPMIVGARWGVELAARLGAAGAPRLRRSGWVAMIVASFGVLALGAAVSVPATTAPIPGPDGEPLPGSIAELTSVTIDGREQALMIRGVSTDNPVLLHLAGGPGGTDIGAMRLDAGLEQHFVVVTWDQRGSGKSYGAIDPVDTLTFERTVTDTLAVTDDLRQRFGQERIFIAGQSWGTLPAAVAVHRHPERYAAYVGTGQMVDPHETDRIIYDDVLAWAGQRTDPSAEERLLALGPPPYTSYTELTSVLGFEREMDAYPEFDGRTEMTATIWATENSLMDKFSALRGVVDTFALLYPRLGEVDLRADAPSLAVPVYVVMGEHEARGRIDPAREWFDALDAPSKEWVELPASGHRANFEQAAAYTALLTRVQADALGQPLQ